MMIRNSGFVGVFFLGITALASMTLPERETLRYHLENLYNELDLLVKNQRVDRADLRKQKHDLEELKAFVRIPFKEDLNGLKKSLEESSRLAKIQLTQFKFVGRSPNAQKVPDHLYTDNSKFRIEESQLVEFLFFQVDVTGTQAQVQQWIHSWPNEQMRLTELDSHRNSPSVEKIKDDAWKVHAHAFRFRNLKFPTLVPRNPRSFLPSWAKENYPAFAEKEPVLSDFVTRIEALKPKAAPYYRLREEFLMNDARLSFFLSKAAPRK